ncbi:MAG: hypothetical protein ACK501_01210 [Planctomycetota bacterium]
MTAPGSALQSGAETAEPGQKVRDIYGRAHVVAEQIGCAVFVEGGGWFHPTKVFPVG